MLCCAARPAKIQAASTTLGTCRPLFDYNVSVIQVTEVEILGFALCDRAQQCPAIRQYWLPANDIINDISNVPRSRGRLSHTNMSHLGHLPPSYCFAPCDLCVSSGWTKSPVTLVAFDTIKDLVLCALRRIEAVTCVMNCGSLFGNQRLRTTATFNSYSLFHNKVQGI